MSGLPVFGSLKRVDSRSRLGVARELGGARQDVFELAAAFAFFLFAVDAGEEEQGVAVAVHVAAGLAGDVRVAEHAVGHAAGHEPIDGPADVVFVFALAEGAALHEHGHAAQAGHRQRILAAERFPVAVLALGLGQPFQALVHARPELGRDFVGLRAVPAHPKQHCAAQSGGAGEQRFTPRKARSKGSAHKVNSIGTDGRVSHPHPFRRFSRRFLTTWEEGGPGVRT